MKANCWYGTRKMSVEEVPDPKILNSRDAIVKITSTAICGSDLHLYNGYIPTCEKGDIVGHEFMGEVVEIGKDVKNLTVGDRVVVPFPISCGNCFFCKKEMFSLCENSNPNSPIAEKMFGHAPCGIFGYSHMMGGFAGGQAEYARVPFADVGPFKIDGDFTDEQVLFLSDILPTGYMAAEQCNIQPGDTVAVWGCGPVGQFTLQSARLLGAERLIAIDRFPERLKMAQDRHGAIVINYMETDVYEAIQELTGGRGADATIDAVGLEGHAAGPMGMIDKMKTATMMENGRPHALRQAIMCCRKGGTVSVPGVYGGLLDKMPIGAVMNKALTIKTGQTHVHRYMKPLFEKIRSGQLDATYVITHHLPLSEAPKGYEIFNNKQDECIKVVLKPGM